MAFDPLEIRKDFPILSRSVGKYPLIYLDNAATTQMSEPVLRVLIEQLHQYEANVHRGIHMLSEESTGRLENARASARRFLNAAHPEEIIFTSGTTDAINLAAQSFGEAFVSAGDEVLVTGMEHHSNYVPWQQMCLKRGAKFRVLPFSEDGDLRLDLLPSYLTERTRLVTVCAVSNVLGTVNPLKEIIAAAHAAGAKVLIDGAQGVRHGRVDVQDLDCDLFAFSGHKIMGPTGTGVLYGKKELLEAMPPVRFGGGMVDGVREEATTFGELPFKFEAGTPNIAGNIALGAALDYYSAIADEAAPYEAALLAYAEEQLRSLDEVTVLGAPRRRAGVVSFNLKGMHFYDVATLLDKLGIAVRSGHHCAEPLLDACGLTGTVRVSPAFYNTYEEIDALIAGLRRITLLLKK